MGRGSLVAVRAFHCICRRWRGHRPRRPGARVCTPPCGCRWRRNTAPSPNRSTNSLKSASRSLRAAARRSSSANVADEVLARLPTAVVLDLDETVLDNTVYQARLLRDGTSYNAKTWGEWVGAAEAEAVPGARQFIARARALGHTVFYITNRDCTTPAPTADRSLPGENRHHAQPGGARHRSRAGSGAPVAARRAPRMEPPAARRNRRAFIAANYRIVALVGDDLGDFVDPQVYAGDRERLEPRFGDTWFLLPNPIYGSWTKTFDTLEEKYSALHTGDVVLELPGGGPWQGKETRVRIASWNVEYLMTPATHLALRTNCAENGGMVGGDDRTLPCAITKREPRSAGRLRIAAQLRHAAARRHRGAAGGRWAGGRRAGVPGLRFLLQHPRAHAEERIRDSPRPAASLRARVRAAVARQCRAPRRGGHLLPRHGQRIPADVGASRSRVARPVR